MREYEEEIRKGEKQGMERRKKIKRKMSEQ